MVFVIKCLVLIGLKGSESRGLNPDLEPKLRGDIRKMKI